MPIEINPSRINISAGGERRRALPQAGTEAFKAPSRADVNFIPSTESLATLIRSAVEALRRGVTWDRGTILNLLV